MPLLEEKVYTIDDIYALPKGRERSLLMDIYTIWHHLTGHTRKYPWNCQPEFLSTSVP